MIQLTFTPEKEPALKLVYSDDEKPKLQAESGDGVSVNDIALGIMALLAVQQMGKQAKKEFIDNMRKFKCLKD